MKNKTLQKAELKTNITKLKYRLKICIVHYKIIRQSRAEMYFIKQFKILKIISR